MSTAILYRMGSGFPGDVNRTHPASIIAQLIDSVNPPTAYGQAVVVDTASDAGIGGVRPLAAADQSNSTPVQIRGITVRPYPFQQQTTSQAFGAIAIGTGAPPTSGVIDILDWGYISTLLPAGQTCQNGGAVWVWCAASTGAHVQGGFETAASAGNTVPVSNAFFANVPDSSGNVEIRVIL